MNYFMNSEGPTPHDAKKAIMTRNGLIVSVMEERVYDSQNQLVEVDEFDLANPYGLVRTEIFAYYISHSPTITSNRPQYMTFEEIAQEVIPDIHGVNVTISKEVVSSVGKQMLARLYERQLQDIPFTGIKERQALIENQVDVFHEDRKYMTMLMDKQRRKEEGFYDEFTAASRKARGFKEWKEEEFELIAFLADRIRWPENSRFPGKPDWNRVATAFNFLTQQEVPLSKIKNTVHMLRNEKGWTIGD